MGVSPLNHETEISHDLGTFEGFNFRTQSAIERLLTASEVVQWDHDRDGEAEFWPSGDNPGVSLLFNQRSAVSGAELLELDRLLTGLGDDSLPAFLQIHYAVNVRGADLSTLSAERAQDEAPHIFIGGNFLDVRQKAAYELFELYYPDEYWIWEKTLCDGLLFDIDRFLDSPTFSVEEVRLDDQVALLIAPQ